jgi:hypothetical protein
MASPTFGKRGLRRLEGRPSRGASPWLALEMQTLELAFADPPLAAVSVEIQRAFIDAMKTAVRA